MGNLGRTFSRLNTPRNQNATAQQGKSFDDCICEAQSTLEEYGFQVSNIQLGTIQRFSTHENKKSDKSGWYIFHYEDSVLFGSFGCWRRDETYNFTSISFQALPPLKQQEINQKIADRKQKQEKLFIQSQEYVAQESWKIYIQDTISTTHEYLERKKIVLYAHAKVIDGILHIPLFDFQGKLWNWQKINQDSQKWYFKPSCEHSGKKQGCFYPIYGNNHKVLICEGYSTGATLHQETGFTVLCAMDAGNVVQVTQEAQKSVQFQNSHIVICADNDHDKRNLEKLRATGLEVIEAPESKKSGYDFNDFYCDGGSIKEFLFPEKKDKWLVSVNDMIQDLSPPEYIIHKIITAYGLGMLHGQSGHGKTFVALDIAYHIASFSPWHGHKTKGGTVVYLAGEGHHNMKYRFLGLKQKYGYDVKNLHISKSGCDLNTVEGLNRVKSAINEIDKKPRIIFVDTLHRFFEGDENSSKDTKTMIKACDELKNIYNCAVVLVHHTGLSDTAQDRGRGSTAWRGAMDFEYNVKKTNNQLVFTCKKMKDCEEHKPIIFDFQTIELKTCKDEDENAITTKIIDLSEKQDMPNKANDNKVKEDIQLWMSIWKHYGKNMHEERAYITKTEVREYAEEFLEKKKDAANKMTSIGKDRFIGRLIHNNIIQKIEYKDKKDTFFVTDPALNFKFLNSDKKITEAELEELCPFNKDSDTDKDIE